jgi:SAM-dependent methyltransferase
MMETAVPLVFEACVPWLDRLEVERVPCLLCGGEDARPVQRFVLNGHTLATVRCPRDGMLWLDPRPVPAFYDLLYAEHFYGVPFDDPLFEQASLPAQAPPAQKRQAASWRMDEIERYSLDGRVPGRLLEVGFGGGDVLEEACGRGWDVLGVESVASCVESALARGLAAQHGTLADLVRDESLVGTFDAAGMFSVLEHVLDPVRALSDARVLLRAGGVLALRLPETPPEGAPASLIVHVYDFNKETIAALLRRCGFEVLHAETAGIWRPTKYPGELANMNVLSRKPVDDGKR